MIVLGCIVDQRFIDQSFDIVDRAIKGLERDDSTIDIWDIIDLFNKKYSQLDIKVWKVTLDEIETVYYVFGIEAKDISENDTLKFIKKYIQEETKRVIKQDLNVNFITLEEDAYEVYSG